MSTNPDPESRASEESPRARRRWPWILLSGFVVLAGLAAGLRGALPAIAEWALETKVAEALGRPISADNVDLWLIDGGAAIKGVEVGMLGEEPGPDGIADATAALEWSRIYADVDWAAIAAGEIALRQLVLEDPKVQFRLDEDGRLVPLLPVSAPEEEPAEAEAEADGGGTPALRVDRLVLRRAKLRVIGPHGTRVPAELLVEELVLHRASFVDGAVHVANVSLSAPQLRVRRDFRLADDPDGIPEETLSAEQAADERIRVAIDHVTVSGADFTVVEADDSEFVVAYHLDASDINLDPETLFPFEFGLERKGGGSLQVEGKAGVSPPSFDGRVQWQELEVVSLLGFASEELGERVRSGTVSGDLRVEARIASEAGAGLEPGIRLSGNLRASEFDLGDPGSAAVAFADLEVELREGLLPPPVDAAERAAPRFEFERIRWTDPVVTLVRRAAIAESDAAAAAEADPAAVADAAAASDPSAAGEPPAAPVEIALDSLEIAEAEIAFTDETVSPAYRTRLKSVRVGASDLAWPETRARDLKVSGDLDGEGTFTLTGDYTPTAGDLVFETEKVAVTPFNPYALGLAGYRLEGGDLSSKTKIKIRGDVIEIDSGLEFARLAVSEAHDGSFAADFGVPLAVGLALLRDPFGKISLPLPIEIGANGIDTGVNTVIAGALRSAIVGALASPLKIAGGFLAVGTNITQLAADKAVKTEPGSSALEAGQEDKLQALVDLLRARPELTVRLHGRAGEADREALARALLVEQASAREDLPDVAGDNFINRRLAIRALEKQAAGEEVELGKAQQQLIDRWIAKLEIPRERSEALANARAETLRDELAGRTGIDRARIVIAEPVVPDDPGIEVELGSSETD